MQSLVPLPMQHPRRLLAPSPKLVQWCEMRGSPACMRCATLLRCTLWQILFRCELLMPTPQRPVRKLALFFKEGVSWLEAATSLGVPTEMGWPARQWFLHVCAPCKQPTFLPEVDHLFKQNFTMIGQDPDCVLADSICTFGLGRVAIPLETVSHFLLALGAREGSAPFHAGAPAFLHLRHTMSNRAHSPSVPAEVTPPADDIVDAAQSTHAAATSTSPTAEARLVRVWRAPPQPTPADSASSPPTWSDLASEVSS